MKILMVHIHPDIISNAKKYAYLSGFYDKYAGSLYGIILSIVDTETIACKVLELSFKDHLQNEKENSPKLVSEFTALSNQVRKKSVETIKAIHIFGACNNNRQCIPK